MKTRTTESDDVYIRDDLSGQRIAAHPVPLRSCFSPPRNAGSSHDGFWVTPNSTERAARQRQREENKVALVIVPISRPRISPPFRTAGSEWTAANRLRKGLLEVFQTLGTEDSTLLLFLELGIVAVRETRPSPRPSILLDKVTSSRF